MPVPINIKNELQELNADIRAEVIVSQLIAAGMLWDEIVVHANRFFYRRFSRDIFDTEVEDNNAFRTILHIHTSRVGLYDILPEGLFFQTAESAKKAMSVAEMAEEYRINKRQELEIRKFFSPLENEFFFHRYKNFIEEKSLLSGLYNEQLNRYFIQFWNLPQDIPAVMALRLTLLLPYVHQVAGDAALMAGCLQCILDEKVSCRITNQAWQLPDVNYNTLGQFCLGNDLVCGNIYQEDEYCFLFTISDLQQSAAQDYLPGGRFYMTLQTFYRFFVPVNALIKTDIQLKKTKKRMQIGDMEEATLGIATII